MTTRTLVALGAIVAFTTLAGVAFSADQKAPSKAPGATPSQPSSTTSQPVPNKGTQDQPLDKRHAKKRTKPRSY